MRDESTLEAVKKFGTPLYIYDLESVSEQYNLLKSWLPDPAEILYSLKANPVPSIVRHLSQIGAGLEVSSLGELSVAIDSLNVVSKILISGPGKTKRLIQEALTRGVDFFSVESPMDLHRILAESRERGTKVRLLFRVNPKSSLPGLLSMTGKASPFGIEEDDAPDLVKLAAHDPSVKSVGLHVYYGTQATLEGLRKAVASIESIAEKIELSTGVVLDSVDFGGGFPWPFGKHGQTELGEKIRLDSGRKRRVYFEAGRFLVAASGNLCLEVLDVKVSKGKSFIIADGGINVLGGMTGLSRLLPADFDVQILKKESVRRDHPYTICGPLCSPLDMLNREVWLPNCEPGDHLVISNVGAYGATASLTNFLSHPPPEEVSFMGDRFVNRFQLGFGHGAIYE